MMLDEFSPGAGKVILDVGCSNGFFGRQAPQHTFYGIEIDPAAGRKASEVYKDVRIGDLDEIDLPYEKEQFDVLLCAAVLEHLRDPVGALRRLEPFLKPGAIVIASLPNVAHFSTRMQLLLGNFNYTEAGILDRTHLHLYTKETAPKLYTDAGYRVDKLLFPSDRFAPLLRKAPVFAGLLAWEIVVVGRPPPRDGSR